LRIGGMSRRPYTEIDTACAGAHSRKRTSCPCVFQHAPETLVL